MKLQRATVVFLGTLLLLSCENDPAQPEPNGAPATPSNPFPEHLSANHHPVRLRLAWSSTDPNGDSIVYDVFLGTTTLAQVGDDLPIAELDLELDASTRYRWQVIARDSRGETARGPIWEFSTGDPELEEGLIAWIPFDGLVRDDGPRQFPTRSENVTLVVDRAGRVANAGRFDGTSSQVVVADAPVLRFGEGSFTVSAWVLANEEPANFAGIVAKQLDDASQTLFPGFQVSFRAGGTIEAALASDIERAEIISGTSLVDGLWHMVTMIVDSVEATQLLYIDGVLQGSRPRIRGSASTAADLIIGRERRGHVFFKGFIDDVSLFSRALSAEEVLRLRRYHNVP